MHNRLALWGSTTNPERNVLVAIALGLEERKVDIWLFDKNNLPTGFASEHIKKWVEGEEISFPDYLEHRIQDLDDQSLLPEDIRVEKPETIRKAQNEWAYEILAQKTYESFKSEITEIAHKINEAIEYKPEYWDTTKGIWDRIVRLRNDNMLRKQYAEDMKEAINKLFDKLKVLKDSNSKVLESQSAELLKEYKSCLANIDNKITEAKDVQSVFNELKQLQEKIKNARIIISHRKELWAAIDKSFNAIKGKRNENRNNFLTGRIDGLKKVTIHMEKGLMRDKENLNFQFTRNNDPKSSQLEMQLRKAKIQVLKDTIKSKEEKLSSIYKTIAELENKSAKSIKKQMPNILNTESKDAETNKIEVDNTINSITDSIEMSSGDDENLTNEMEKVITSEVNTIETIATEEISGKTPITSENN